MCRIVCVDLVGVRYVLLVVIELVMKDIIVVVMVVGEWFYCCS